jgi:predicted KAP-like P-loop ATPase
MADLDWWMDDLTDLQKAELHEAIANNLDLYAVAERHTVQQLLEKIKGSKAVIRALVKIYGRQEAVSNPEHFAQTWDYATHDGFQRLVRRKADLPDGPDYVVIPRRSAEE